MKPAAVQPAAFLTMVNISEEDWSYRIDAQKRIVGRSSTADIRIPAKYEQVSRHHAAMWWENGRCWVNDLGSSGGTHVNGICLEKGKPVTLTIGDRISLSDVELKLVGEVSKLAALMVETGISAFSAAEEEDEEVSGGTDVKKSLPQNFVRSMMQQLTAAELDVVLWMYRGYTSDQELGRTLFRSPNTIRTQVGSIFSKLNLHSRTEIVSWLKRAGNLARPEEKTVRSSIHDTVTW